MKILRHTFLMILSVGLLSVFAADAMAQEQRRAAVQAFNQARELAQNQEYEQAITKFEEAISAGEKAESAGEKGADIVKLSKEQLPNIYYEKALNNYKAFQNSRTVSSLETTIESFEEAVDAGEQYGAQSVVDKSTSNITQLMYMRSVLQYSQKDFEAALASADEVIERNANYEKAYYQKGLILKKMDGRFEDAMAAFEKAIELAEKNNNSEIARKAQENASGELVYRGVKQVEGKNYTRGIELLNRALEFNAESADAYYRLAQAYNQRGDWEQGLNHGQKALDLENGGRTAQAKIHFEIANAYKGQGNFEQACDSYDNAAYGSFKQPAEHQMEYELNCKNL